MEVIGSTELVGSYWYKKPDGFPVEFTIYGYQTDEFSNEYEYYDVYDSKGILLGINLTGHFSFDHFPLYHEVYDLIKTDLENNYGEIG